MCVSFSPHLHYSAPPSHSLCPTSAPAQSGQYTLMALPAGSGAFTVRALHQEASVKGKVQVEVGPVTTCDVSPQVTRPNA